MKIEKYDFSSIVEDKSKKLVLVIYDIVDNRRRNRMVKLLESYGTRVQLSAFEVLVTGRQHIRLTEQIAEIMSDEDNVRMYRLNSSNEVLFLGTSETVYEDEVIIV